MYTLILLACIAEPEDSSLPGLDYGDTFVGTEVMPGVLIAAANPDPPDIGENTWVLDVEGAAISVTPTMPEHGHGTTPPTFEGVVVTEGFEVGPMPLQMAGLWSFAVVVDEGDPLVFSIWLEG
jgi:hypothetical protein